MKILHLLYESKGDSFGIGGVGIRAYKIYNYLKERHDITLLCKKYPGAEDQEIESLRHIFVGTESKSLTKTLLSYAFHATLFVKKHSGKFDIVVLEFSPAIPTFLHVFTQKPVILQIQGYTGVQYFGKYNPLYALVLFNMERVIPRFYHNFIFASCDTVQKFSLETKSNIMVIPNGISSTLLNTSPEDRDYILYLGRIDIFGKGLDILLTAFKEFSKAFRNIRLVIAGDGRDMDTFKSKIMMLPEEVRNNIEVIGWVSGAGKIDIIKNSLYAVFPSRHEVNPISTLEAMACGKAVIVSDIPELRYVMQSKAGISFKAGDALSLAHSMKEIMLSGERKEMGQRGRNWVKSYTWEKIALQYEEFLKSVLEKA
jgi:glycosyltransferase involved in cell wall biosynthesis